MIRKLLAVAALAIAVAFAIPIHPEISTYITGGPKVEAFEDGSIAVSYPTFNDDVALDASQVKDLR